MANIFFKQSFINDPPSFTETIEYLTSQQKRPFQSTLNGFCFRKMITTISWTTLIWSYLSGGIASYWTILIRPNLSWLQVRYLRTTQNPKAETDSHKGERLCFGPIVNWFIATADVENNARAPPSADRHRPTSANAVTPHIQMNMQITIRRRQPAAERRERRTRSLHLMMSAIENHQSKKTKRMLFADL